MNQLQKRKIMFLFGCIVVRFLFVLISKYINPRYLPILGILALIPAAGFTVIYLFDLRKRGNETFGQKIWWNNLRPIHASLYILFALLALKENKYSWIPLLLDVIIGLGAFINHHYL